MAMDAGMETCRVRRSDASASGRITIAASAAEMTAFSPNASLAAHFFRCWARAARKVGIGMASVLMAGLSCATRGIRRPGSRLYRKRLLGLSCRAFWDRRLPQNAANRLPDPAEQDAPEGRAFSWPQWLPGFPRGS